MIAPSSEAVADTFELDDLFALTEHTQACGVDVNELVHELVGAGDLPQQRQLEDALRQGECWGSELHGQPLHCDPGFRVAGNHLKDKFCRACREGGVLVPVTRIRAIGREQHAAFSNAPSEGLWNAESTASLPDYRLINHTQGCTEPRLLVFQTPPPPSHAWATLLPPGWLHATAAGDHIRLWSSKGTLVPTRPRNRPRFGLTQPQPAKRQHTTATATDVPGGVSLPLAEGCIAATAVSLGPHPPLVLPASCDRRSPASTSSSKEVLLGDGGADSADSADSASGANGGPDGSADGSAHLTSHSAFLLRFVAAHTKLRSLIEERLRSSEPMSAEQRDTLLEQVRASERTDRPRSPLLTSPSPAQPHAWFASPRPPSAASLFFEHTDGGRSQRPGRLALLGPRRGGLIAASVAAGAVRECARSRAPAQRDAHHGACECGGCTG